jgi:hypothetical protein
MSEDTSSRLAALRRKIEQNEEMILWPCVSEEELQAFEHTKGVILPGEYRQFLKEVSNGVGAVESEHLPIYEIFALGDGFFGDKLFGDMSKPFPFAEAVNYDADGYPDGDDHATDGWLYLCHVGCGTCWVLIVTGPERGNMWLSTEGYFPSTPRIGFLDWCEQWAERGYDDGLEDLAYAGADGEDEDE